MLAQRISSINSISSICEATGADINQIALSIGLDPRIGPQYLKAGLGFGGSCFKKDILSLIYLSQSLGLHEVGDYWQQVLTLNDFQRNRFARRVITRLNNTLVRKKITLLGYAFKKNTSDTRESPAIDVVRTLLGDGPAEIAIFDPCCDPVTVSSEIQSLLGSADERLLKSEGGPVEVYTDVYAACLDSNAVVILTEWDEFRNTPVVSKAAAKNGLAAAGTKTSKVRKVVLPDPRPFQSPEPSESDLLALHHYLVSQSTTSRPSQTPSNTFHRYLPEAACPETCATCASDLGAYSKAGEQLDWTKIAEGLRSPKWVFDGRGILDMEGLEMLGCRVEGVGRVSSWAR